MISALLPQYMEFIAYYMGDIKETFQPKQTVRQVQGNCPQGNPTNNDTGLKMKKSKKIKKDKPIPPRKFNIESINGIELAHTTIPKDEKVSDKHVKHITKLSEIASRKYGSEGRGSFLIVSESNPSQAVYLPTPELLECIRQLIPEAFNKVQDIVNQYDPQEQFVVINVFSRRRIAITTEILRLAV